MIPLGSDPARSKPIVPPNVLVDGICMGGAGEVSGG